MAKTTQQSRLGLGCAWSRASHYALTTAPERTYLVLTVEGGFEFTIDGIPAEAGPGSLTVLSGETPTTVRTLEDTARFVWYLEPTMLVPGRSRFQHGEVIPTNGTPIAALTAMTKAILSSPLPRTAASSHHTALAFENLLAGVLADSSDRIHPKGAHQDGVFTAMLATIEARFRDPALTVGHLAKELNVSVSTLHEAAATIGTTPRREIERRRLTEATRLTEIGTHTRVEVAEQSGFTCTRQLTRAQTRNT